jgi:succinoglycan biosynthesis transport protein ExoP
MQETKQQQLHLRHYAQVIVRRKWFIIIPVVMVPLVAILVTFFLAPTFQSTTSILISESTILPPTVERNLQTQTQPQWVEVGNIQTAYANQIKSTQYLKSLIAKLDIRIPDDLKKAVAERARTMPDVDPNDLGENLLVESIRKMADVRMNGSNIIIISLVSSSPVLAQKMTQALAEIFLEENLAHELAGLQGSLSFTEEQIALYRDKLYTAEDKLRSYRQAMIESNVTEDSTSLNSNLNSILSAIQGLEAELSASDQERNDVRAILFGNKIDPATIQLPTTVVNLKTEIMGSISRLAELLGRNNWRDAKVMTLNQEAKDILVKIESETRNYVSMAYPTQTASVQGYIARYLVLNVNIDFLTSKKTALERSVGHIKSRLSRDPDVEVTLQRLQSEVTRYRDLYNLFMQHSQYAAIDQSAKKVEAQSKYMIVQPASLPLSPISPDRKKMALLGLVLGLALGASVIILMELMDDSYKTVEQVQESLKLQVLATIPRINTPYTLKRKDRGFIYTGAAICVVLVAAIIIMRIRNG